MLLAGYAMDTRCLIHYIKIMERKKWGAECLSKQQNIILTFSPTLQVTASSTQFSMSADDSAADSAGARYEICLHSLGLPFHDHAKDLSLLGPTPSDATPIGAPAKGSDDIPNIVYINAFPKDLDPKDFDELQEANETTSQFFSVRAAEQAEKQISKGALPADSSKEAQIKRANYRAYVIDYLTQKASW